jgi:hypothetical protein
MRRIFPLLALALIACDSEPTTDAGRFDAGPHFDAGRGSDAGPFDAGPRPDAGRPPEGLAARQRALAEALRPGQPAHFMFGLGNDLAADHDQDGAYTLGTTLDLHYAYLVGLSDEGGWVTWNSEGSFPDILDAAAARHGVTSMFTIYVLGVLFEQGRDPIHDAGDMDVYWQDLVRLATRLGALNRPFVVHSEPDGWGYFQQRAEAASETPSTFDVRIHTSNFHECDDLPETIEGFGRCNIRVFRTHAPMAKIGFHASSWAAWYDPTDASADVGAAADRVAQFLLGSGAADSDFVVVDPLDRDAGYWETHEWSSSAGAFVRRPCDAVNTGRGYPLYLDETNTTYPNYHQYLAWVRALAEAMQLPVIFWQVPLGVPSDECGGPGGGVDGRYRDNHVRYFFSHVDELVAAGGAAAVFGTGADLQTYITTDGNQFRTAVNGYFASPFPLP